MITVTDKSIRWDDDDDRVKAILEHPDRPIPPAVTDADREALKLAQQPPEFVFSEKRDLAYAAKLLRRALAGESVDSEDLLSSEQESPSPQAVTAADLAAKDALAEIVFSEKRDLETMRDEVAQAIRDLPDDPKAGTTAP